MNLRRDGGGYALRLDLLAIRAMLLDYYERDLWGVLETPGAAAALGLVIAGRASVFDEAARERAARAAATNPSLAVTVLHDAGHWLHVDDPEGTVAALAGVLERAS
jgi:pimeloyl-ACP methyl ester carboxylesterase